MPAATPQSIQDARAKLDQHVRETVPLHVRETGVELTLETRGLEHTAQVLETLKEVGYEVQSD